MQVPKAIKEEYGGGMKEFTLSEVSLTCQNHSLPFFWKYQIVSKKDAQSFEVLPKINFFLRIFLNNNHI